MKRSNFTFTFLFALFGFLLAPLLGYGQCPTNPTVTPLAGTEWTANCDGTYDLDWAGNADLFTVVISDNNGATVFGPVSTSATIITNFSIVNTAGAPYSISVTATCGVGTNADNSDLGGYALPLPPTITVTKFQNGVAPSCPGGADGTMIISLSGIIDAACDGTTIDITLDGVGTLTTTAGGSVTFTGLTAGFYTGSCAVNTVEPGCVCPIFLNFTPFAVTVPAGVADADDIYANIEFENPAGFDVPIFANDVLVAPQPLVLPASTNDCKMVYNFDMKYDSDCEDMDYFIVQQDPGIILIDADPFYFDVGFNQWRGDFGVELEPGSYTFTVTAVDVVGNFHSNVFSVEVDAPPVEVITSDHSVTIPECVDQVFGSWDITLNGCDILNNFDFALLDIQPQGPSIGITNILPFPTQAEPNQIGLSVFFVAGSGSSTGTPYFVGVDYDGSTSLGLITVIEEDDPPPVVVAQSQNATIPKCEFTTEVCVSVTVIDQCGLDPNGLAFSGAISGSGTYVGNNTFEFCGLFGVTNTTYTATYKGESATANIVVNLAAEDELPIIAAADVNEQIAACQDCDEVEIYFTIHDDCQPVNPANVIYDDGGAGLTFFGISDINGNSTTFWASGCVEPGFWIQHIYYEYAPGQVVSSHPAIFITQESTLPINNLACNDVINLSLDAGCKALINADMFTEGSNACLDDFTISIPAAGLYLSGSDQYYVTIPAGQHLYEISHPDAVAPCWGYINVERKLIPDPIYRYREIMCTESTKFIYDRDDVLDALAAGCYSDVTDITYSDYDYGDLCEENLTWHREWRGFVTIDGKKEWVLLLVEWVTEIPLTFDMINMPLGGSFDYPVEVWCPYGTSPEDIAAHYSKKCYDKKGKEFVIPGWQYAYPNLLKGTIDSYDRSCYYVDYDSIATEKIQIDDKWVLVDVVYKLQRKVCDGPYVVVSKKPNYVPLKKGKTCNIDVKCVDMKFESCTGPETKVMRTWTLLDWCNGTIAEHVQWIKVVDKTPPVIYPDNKGKKRYWPNQYVSIAPWTCAGEYAVNIPVVDNCSYFETKIYTSVGQVGSDNVIRGLWKDESPVYVKFTARDACGNEDYVDFYIYVEDYIPPVMIAEDQVNVSLTGDIHGTGDDLGVAKVYTDAIDAGSHDAGCGPVDLCLLLKEELENPIYHPIYGNHVEVDYVGDDEEGDGISIYHAAQCAHDGVIEFEVPDGKGTKLIHYYYVVCKEYVKFCCEDIGDNQVALVGTDHYGNYNHSWTTVTVEDKSYPIVDCHYNDYLDCLEDYDVYDYAPTIYNALCSVGDLDYSVYEDVDACGQGHVEIIWTLDGEVICITYLYYNGVSQFDPYNIRWPKHYNGEVEYGIVRECEPYGDGTDYLEEYYDYVYMGDQFECEGDVLQGPVWCDAACSLIGSNYEDLEVDATDACRKIIRRWTVIDWCTWDPNGFYPADDTNDEIESFIAVDDEWLTRDGLGYVYSNYYDKDGVLRCEECLHNSGDSDDVYFRYTYAVWDGYYTYDQVIKIIDETPAVIDAPEEVDVAITDGADAKGDDYDDCYASETVDAKASDLCGDAEIDASSISWYIHTEDADGNTVAGPKSVDGPDASMTTGSGYPGDVHTIVWQVQDGCGNHTTAYTTVTFTDTKNPTPVCLQDISTATMNNAEGSVTIWAADYDLGSFDNCSPVDVWFKDTADNFVPSLTFTCADIPNGVSTTVELKLYVVDATGNYDYCFVTLRIDDNTDACEDVDVGAANISGFAQDAFGNRMESAMIMLNQADQIMTPVEGTYAFNDNTKFAAYEISAVKNDNFLNGVTTLDVVLLQQHILGLKMLDSPYKVISADVNNSETITATDIVELRKLILGVYTELPNNMSWRFVDASQVFDDPNDPFPFTETLKISSLEGPMPDQNFIAAKIGDVSGNAFANSLQAGPRSAGTLTLEVAETTVTKGSEISVDVRGTNFAEVSGYQFTMEISGMEFAGVESGALNVTSENFGVLNANTVTTSWGNPTPVSTSNEVLFTMKFRATTDVTLSEGLKVSSRVTEAVAYTGTDYTAKDVEMVYGNAENIITAASFELGQNEPNPFNERTVIGFVLPRAGQATLSVFDVTGKLVVEKSGEFAKGANTITLTNGELGTSGVLYYQLESGEHKATRKMILMN